MFGKVVDDDIIINNLPLFVERQIKETNVVRPYVEIISYIVIHDHIHMMIQIHECDLGRRNPILTSNNHIEYEHGVFTNKPVNQFGSQLHNLASIICGFKSIITSYTKKKNISFKRQSNYYEHMVRNNDDLENIIHYIETNPIRRTKKQSNALL